MFTQAVWTRIVPVGVKTRGWQTLALPLGAWNIAQDSISENYPSNFPEVQAVQSATGMPTLLDIPSTTVDLQIRPRQLKLHFLANLQIYYYRSFSLAWTSPNFCSSKYDFFNGINHLNLV